MGGMGGGMGGGGMGGGMFDVNDRPAKSSQSKTPEQLIRDIASDDADLKIQAENELSAWVATKMTAAKKASDAKKFDEANKNFEEVISVVSDAMRESLPAVWMYDALSTAMQACNYPATSIRRVLLSSIDYGGDETAAMKIAEYLAGAGMKKDALMVLRDVHRANPIMREPLELALNLGLELEDQDAIRWASTGVLGQAWTDEQLPLIEKALLAAKAHYIRLNETKEPMKAYAFEQELKSARVRDLVVRVVWTGNADVDIAVEEPTGTICEMASPRTSSGGLLLADSSSLSGAAKDGFSETYVCTKGYAGAYKIVIKKIWGDVAGGKVTVNMISDYGTPDQKLVQQTLSLDNTNNAAAIIAHVKNGHRTEPIVEAHLAKVRDAKALVGGSVLAQGAGNPSNDAAGGDFGTGDYYQQLLSSYMSSRFNNGSNGRPNGQLPLMGRGVVGYRPVIVPLPSGAQLFATAVISGDRRYVRITPSPNFFDIVAVDTFNIATGATGNGGGGGLGGGGGGLGGGGGFGGGGAF